MSYHNKNQPFKKKIAAGFLACALGSTAVSAFAENGPYINYEYPESMTLLGGAPSKKIDCGLFARLPEEPGKIYPTCEAAEAADNNSQEICNVTIPSGADKRTVMAVFSTVQAFAYGHFARAHKVCIAQDAMLQWQLAVQKDVNDFIQQNPGATSAQITAEFSRAKLDLMDDYDIPQNPENPANWDAKYQFCPFSEIGRRCKSALGLE